ncbi:glyoxalase [Brachybacterium endophyticum]|uniref:Glyoxalase n=2 Tax=Brachybacterium endophyticum TaxID=2182385 RepID=A0A2U2RPV0_9MICO|nr:VOC family protein [Brachybacterium endophyticum]PWH07908.1 glyoxalase [Brachybacterium endophyticum]
MDIAHQVVVFDAAELEPESTFWAGVLEGEVDVEDDWHMITVDGAPKVGVQLAPDHVAPDWPEESRPQQIHLDLYVHDFPTAHEKVMALGARVLKEAKDATPNADFQVYADPAGHPFCLCIIT